MVLEPAVPTLESPLLEELVEELVLVPLLLDRMPERPCEEP